MIGARILLVDDETVFADNMSRLLEERGYDVTAVNNGESAVSALEKESFDVVVLDLKMPGMDGITTMKEFKKLGIFTETLILTGHGSINTALEAIKLGAYDYLNKPCEIDELVEKIEGAWEKKGETEKRELEDKIRKAIEAPSAALSFFGKKN